MKEEENAISKKSILETATDFVAPAAGTTIGAIAGGFIAGPGGVAVGSIVGTAIEKVLESIGSEIGNRLLSPSEARRVGTVFELAKKYIAENIEGGRSLRGDDFFQEQVDNRSSAEEILEGVLLSAQREYEEKKLKLIAKMYSNIVFTPEITRPIANKLIKIVEQLTYRQILIVHVIGINQLSGFQMPFRNKAYTSVSGTSNVTIAAEIFELYRMSLLASSTVIHDSAGINPALLSLCGYGVHICKMMELLMLNKFDNNDLEIIAEITKFLVGND